MQAMILEQPAPVESNPLIPREIPDPEPGVGELRIRISHCGLCRTDLHQVEGELPLKDPPVIPGHQIVGRVDRLGEGAGRRFRPGERVGLPWLHSTCGRCPSCLAGSENLCRAARFTGYDRRGGYAQYVVAPEDFTLRLPEGFDDAHAAPLLCAGIIGYRALRLSGVRPGETLGLYGFGASAHVCIQIALFWQCRVIVVTRTEAHRRLALRLGARWAGGAEERLPELLDRAIIFAPAGALVPHALEALNRGGTVALAGIYMDRIPPLDYERHLYLERVLRSVTAATRMDAQELLDLAGRIPIATEIDEIELADANRGLQRLKQSALHGAGVLRIP
jgi:propanol-preferring alcohol dehydrogenase